MTEFDKCTCVKVNKEKMDLIKAKGLNLQDLLDKAMDDELQFKEVSHVDKKIEDLSLEIKKLEDERNECIRDFEKKMDTIMKNFMESKNREEEYYNKHIHYLKLELEYLKRHNEK